MKTLKWLQAVTMILGTVAVITSALVHGDNAKEKPFPKGFNPNDVKLNEHLMANRFANQPVVSYETAQGELLFALQLKVAIPTIVDNRPRDIVFLVDTSASQAGKFLSTTRTIVEKATELASPKDRLSLWVANTPKATRSLTGGLFYKDKPGQVESMLKNLESEYSSGAVDLRNAIEQAMKDFESKSSRQQVLVYIGDAESAMEPLAEKDRYLLANKVRESKVQFFAVPLGLKINGLNMHSIITGSGGAVVRFPETNNDQVKSSKQVAKDMFAAFGVPVLFPSKFNVTSEVTELYPTRLPPLRQDTPTLLMGKCAQGKKIADLVGTIAGRVANTNISVNFSEKVPAADSSNFMLATMIRQWSESTNKEAPSILRADRALALAYEQSRLTREEYLTQAQWALGVNRIDAAKQLSDAAFQLDPNDSEVRTMKSVVEKLGRGELTIEAIKAATNNKIGVAYEKLPNGRFQQVRVNLEDLAKDDQPTPPKNNPTVQVGDPKALLQAEQARRAILEQQVTNTVHETLYRGRQLLRNADPKSAKDLILAQRDSIVANKDISDGLRDKLVRELGDLLSDIGQRGETILRERAEETERIQRARAKLLAIENDVAREERNRQRVKAFTQLMTQARYEDAYREALVMNQEAINEGRPVAVESQAVYQMGQAATNLREMRELRRIREDRFLLAMMQVEKSHIPYPDEPPVHFPPSKVWKDLLQLRKKYAVQDFDGDMPARQRRRWNFLKSALQAPVNIPEKENTLGLLIASLADQASGADKDRDPAKKVTIVLDIQSFADAAGGKFEPEVTQIKFPTPLVGVSLETALRLIAAQLPAKKYEATYVVRPDYIELIPGEKALADKVVRAFPVEELIFGIPNSINTSSLAQTIGALGRQASLGGGFTGQALVGGFGPFNGGGGGGGQIGNNGAIGGAFNGGNRGGVLGFGGGVQGQFGNLGGQFGLQGNNSQNGVYLVQLISQLVDPGRWKIGLYSQMNLNMDPNGGAGDPMDMGVPAQELNSIEYYPPARALIIQGTTRFQRNTNTRLRPKENPVNFVPNNQVNAGGNAGNKAAHGPVAPPVDMAVRVAQMKKDPEGFFTKTLNEAKVDPGVIIASSEFLVKAGENRHAADLIKASLRSGIVAEPWAQEALALALEGCQGSVEEIERARVSAIDLAPKSPDAYLKAAKAMSGLGDVQRALKFCKAAARVEPNMPDPYINALVFATDNKTNLDAADSIWIAGNLLGRDWVIDAPEYHLRAKEFLKNSATRLMAENKLVDAKAVQSALENEKNRDLVIELLWSGIADLDLKVREPIGTYCTSLNKQTTAGGVLLCDDFTQKVDARSETYTASKAFDGSYDVSVNLVSGRPLGEKALIKVTRFQGTPQQTVELYNLSLSENKTIHLTLQGGRRKTLASVPLPGAPIDYLRKPEREREVMNRLNSMTTGVSNSTGFSGSGGTINQSGKIVSMNGSEMMLNNLSVPGMLQPIAPGGAELRQEIVFSKNGSWSLQVAPVFETASADRGKLKLDFIPGAE